MSVGRKLRIVLLALAGLILIGLLLIHTAPVRHYVLFKAEAALRNEGIGLQASALHYDLFRLSASLTNVVISSLNAPDLPPIATMARVYVNLAFAPLLHGVFRITDAQLDRPAVHVVLARPGVGNLPGSFGIPPPTGRTSGKANATGSKVQIRKLTVTQGSFLLENRAAQFSMDLPRWRLALQQNTQTHAHELTFATGEAGRATLERRVVAIRDVALHVNVGANGVVIDTARIEAADSSLSLQGTVANLSAPEVDITANADLSLKPLADFAAWNEKTSGRLVLQVGARGPLSGLRVQAAAHGKNLRVAEIRSIRLTADATYSGTAKRLRVASFDIVSDAGDVHARGDIALAAASGGSSLTGRFVRLNLQTITRLFHLNINIASRATGDWNAAWPDLNFRQAEGRAALHLVKLRGIPAKDVLPLSGDVVAVFRNGSLTFSLGRPSGGRQPPIAGIQQTDIRPASFAGWPRSRIVSAAYHPGSDRPRRVRISAITGTSVPLAALLKIFALQRGSGAAGQSGGFQALEALATLLRGRITIGPNGAIRGRLQAHVTNIEDLLHNFSAFRGAAAPLAAVPIRGAADISADISGTLSAPKADLRVSAPALQIGVLQGISLELNGNYQSSRFTIRSGTARWQGGTLRLSGTMSLQKNGPLNLDVEVTNGDIAAVLAGLGKGRLPIAGSFSMSAHIAGTLHNPAATVSAAASGLQIYGEPWGRADLQAHLRNRQLEVTQLHLDKTPGAPGGGTLTATAAYNLASQAYSAELRGNDLHLEHITLPNGTTLRGTVNLTAAGKGTTDNPTLSMTLNANRVDLSRQAIGTIAARLHVANQRAQFNVQAPDLNLSAAASIGIKPPFSSTFSAAANQADLAKLPLPGAAGQFTGILTAAVKGSGDWRHLKDLNVALDIQQMNVSRGVLQLHATGPIHIAYMNQALRVEPATIVANGAPLKIAGELPLEAGAGRRGLRLNGDMDLQAVRQMVPRLQQATMRGQLHLDLILGGSLQQLSPQGALTVHNGFIQTANMPSPLQDLNAAVRLQDGAAVLEQASARWAGGSITANGELPLSLLPAKLPIYRPATPRPARVTVDARGLQVAEFPKAPDKMKGVLSLHLDAEAPRLALVALTAALRFDQLTLSFNGIPVQQQDASVIVLRNGTATVRHLKLSGPDTQIELAGTAGLASPHALDLKVQGSTNAALASTFVSGVQLTGKTNLQVAVTGTIPSPGVEGYVALQNGTFGISNPSVAITGLNLRVNLQGSRAELAQFTGHLNGGPLEGGGGFNFGKSGLQNVALKVSATDVYMDFPDGLRTISNLSLALTSQENLLVLGGQVRVLEGSFRRYINLQGQVLNFLQTGASAITPAGQPSPFLSRLRFNVAVTTVSPLLIENNIAKTAVIANVRLVGEYYRPSVTGRIQLEETGELYLNGRTFYIDQGIVTFLSEQRIEPDINLLAETQAAGYNITMQVQGVAGKLTTTLTSDPPLSQADIVGVLVFGRPLNEIRGAEVNVASQEVLAYVAGGLGSALSNRLQQTFGLSEVRIEPALIAGEANPNARLTIGQNLTSALKLIYSMNMINAGDQIWIGEYDITRRFLTRLTKQSDNSYRFDLRNDWRFGGTSLIQGGLISPKKTITEVNVSGGDGIGKQRLEDLLKIRPGQKYDFFKVQRGTDRIANFYRRRGQLEARVYLNTVRQDSAVTLNLDVKPGPAVRFAYEGWEPPGGVKNQIRKIWEGGVFDLQRVQDAVSALRTALVNKGYLQAAIQHEIKTPSPGQKEIVFEIDHGRQFREVGLIFPGATGIPESTLSDVLKDAKLRDRILAEPEQVKSVLQNYYADHGYLTAAAKDPEIRVNEKNNTGVIAIPIVEGPRYRIRDVQFQGNRAFPESQLKATADIPSGGVYSPALRSPAIMRIQDLYWNNGYNDMSVQYGTRPEEKTGTVDIVFHIAEGKQQILHNVSISGTRETRPSLVRSQLLLKPGDVISSAKLTKSRSNLYSMGAYQFVEINRTPLSAGIAPDRPVPVDLSIKVHEVQPFRFKYGGYYDTDRGPGVIADLSNTNSLGSARVVGLQARYDANLQDGRLYFSQPLLRRFPVRSIAETFFTRDVRSAFIDDHIGISIGQETRFHNDYVFNYSYRLERTRVFNLTDAPLSGFGPSSGGGTGNGTVEGIDNSVTVPPFGSVSRRLAPLTLTLTRDTRNDVLNATRGLFFSHGLSTGFGFLGSEQHYMKYLGQYYQFISLGKRRPVPFKPNLKRSRLVYAGAVRLGLAGGFGGQDLIQSERFFAGGGTTIRGFAQDAVGPHNADGVPVGGDALLIVNNELRFPLLSIFDGVGFIDVGNVYSRIQDFNPTKLRKAAGFGIRVHTPWVLLRADYGIKLDRKPGESFGQLFFSIGQAF